MLPLTLAPRHSSAAQPTSLSSPALPLSQGCRAHACGRVGGGGGWGQNWIRPSSRLQRAQRVTERQSENESCARVRTLSSQKQPQRRQRPERGGVRYRRVISLLQRNIMSVICHNVTHARRGQRHSFSLALELNASGLQKPSDC